MNINAPDDKGPYYITESGRKVYFSDIARAIDTLHPRLRDEHVVLQLQALGLYGEMHRATTCCMLPYSFSEYLPKD